MDKFYSDDSVAQWRAVLGPNMHYHHGVWEQPRTFSNFTRKRGQNEIDEEALSRAITMLYP
jgi:hypothetical protein